MSSFIRLLIVAAVLSLVIVPLAAQGKTEPSEALLEDAAWYADHYGVDQGEALRRLQLQREIGDLQAELSREEEGAFAGMWIEHRPDYRVVVRSSDPFAGERLAVRIAGTALEGLVETRSAKHSLVELEENQAVVRNLAGQLGITIDSDVNVFENRVEVYALAPQTFLAALSAAALELPAGVEVIAVDRLAQPYQQLLRGGEDITACTGGFTVRSNSSGELGISTAAHCNNVQAAAGTNLPFRAEDQQGNQDVQWNAAACGMTVSNDFNSGIGFRACTGTRHRNSQVIDEFVCKWGVTTGRTCGDIVSKSYAPSYVTNASSTFIRVDGDGDIGAGGDSGGPWFSEHLAYGITSGEPGPDPDDVLYMAINYISSIGVSVLTSDPGPAAELSASLSCSGNFQGSSQVSCQAVVAGGTPPYTYSGWSYSGNASSWSASGPWAYAYYSGSGCGSGNVNFFSVTVTDACGNSDFASIGSLPCY